MSALWVCKTPNYIHIGPSNVGARHQNTCICLHREIVWYKEMKIGRWLCKPCGRYSDLNRTP